MPWPKTGGDFKLGVDHRGQETGSPASIMIANISAPRPELGESVEALRCEIAEARAAVIA
jgi:hypothetical protein